VTCGIVVPNRVVEDVGISVEALRSIQVGHQAIRLGERAAYPHPQGAFWGQAVKTRFILLTAILAGIRLSRCKRVIGIHTLFVFGVYFILFVTNSILSITFLFVSVFLRLFN
jgi:hypothetical protein